MLGIIFGVAAVLSMLAIGAGAMLLQRAGVPERDDAGVIVADSAGKAVVAGFIAALAQH